MTTTANPPATGPAYGIGPATGGLRAVAVGDRPGNLAHYASRALVLLSLINMLNYLDRYVVAAVLSSLRTSSLMVDDSQAGLLASSFIIVYTLTSPVFGTLGDRMSRTRLIAFGVVAWSLFTMASGLAVTFLMLLAFRALVGVGEAAYGPTAPALLADYFPKERRGRVFAIFFAAIPIGSALGYSLGGIMDTLFGWREAFFVAGLPGLVCAWFVLRLPDPPRGLHDDPVAVPDSAHAKHGLAGALTSYRTLLRNEPYLVTVLGYAAYTFAVGGLAFWIPTYLEREKGQSIGEATVLFGAIVLVAGLLGTVGGGYLGDWLLSRLRNAYLWVAGVATLVAAPFAFVAIEAESAPIYVPTMLVAMILLFVSASPVNSAIVNAVRADERATAIALSILTIHLLGDVPSPLIIGYVSDATSLETALTIVPFVILGAAVIWLFAALRTRDVSAPAG